MIPSVFVSIFNSLLITKTKFIIFDILKLFQILISSFYYLFFRQSSLMDNKLNQTYWSNFYVVIPLLPISFTIFWKSTTLHGTIYFLKTLSCLKKIVSNPNDDNGSINKFKQDDLFLTKYRKKLKRNSTVKTNNSKRCLLHDESKLILNKKNNDETYSNNDNTNNTNDLKIELNSDPSSLNSAEIDITLLNRDHLTNVNSTNNLDENNPPDISQINELSSIESLLAQVPFENKTKFAIKHNLLRKFWRNIKFHLKIFRSIIFSSSNDNQKDPDIQNAPFIYYSNFLIGLGIITSFSCVDKKGILSWSNPTPEKIWCLTKNKQRKIAKKSKTKNENDLNSDNETQEKKDNFINNSNYNNVNSKSGNFSPSQLSMNKDDSNDKNNEKLLLNNSLRKLNNTDKTFIETFNLTHDNIELKFDDANWIRNIDVLKPIGLSILINTCNMELSDRYVIFRDFIKTESNQTPIPFHNTINSNISSRSSNSSLENEDKFQLKVIFDRRCMCDIANIIGFDRPTAIKPCYDLIGTLSTCRNLEIKSNNKFKPKQIRLSNICSVIANFKLNNITNIYSQGSPDLILDFCTDYWNGTEVCKLNKNQRKKLLDLYQRFSASSYCTAFSYKPVMDEETLEELDFESNKNQVLKCPFNYYEKISNHYNYGHLSKYENSLSNISDFEKFKEKWESVSMNESIYNEFDSKDNKTYSISKTEQIDNILKLQSGHIFLGMASTQYKAKVDVIKLVEKLTKSCIRFIHFSSDNEQISRTFAEMLGLDTGWNCYISLGDDSQKSSSRSISLRNVESNNTNHKNCHRTSILQFTRRLKINKKQNKLSASLPSLKFTKSTFTQNQNASQTVKFNLKNANKKIEKRRKMTLKKINSSDESNNESSSESFSDLNLKSNFKRNRTRSSKSSQSQQIENKMNFFIDINNSKTSVSSYHSLKKRNSRYSGGSVTKKRRNSASICSSSKMALDDDLSSHHTTRTNNSGRSLSETEFLQNFAQLPKGINNIRRHLDNEIDNVPLHVSLFTDCTKERSSQMIGIMRDYGEIVCCFGSSHSISNNELFASANVAIGCEPLYPTYCIYDDKSNIKNEINKVQKSLNTSLINLSSTLNTLSCGFNLNNETLCTLPVLLSLTREMVHSYRIALIFMLMSNISVTFVQLICNCLFLPPILSGFQVNF